MAISKPGVITKFLSASNSRGSRIKGTYIGTGASTTVGYDHALSAVGNHEKLAESMLGTKKLVMASLGDGYVFISTK